MSKRHLLAFACGVVVLGLLALGSYYLIVRAKSNEELAEILAELDANDPGWQRDDLDRVRLAVPAEENSGPIILKLHGKIPAKWLADDPESHWSDRWPNEPLLPVDVAKFDQRMAQVRDLVIEARGLADKPHGCYTIAWTPDSISTLLPHVQEVRELASVLHQDAVWQAHNGKLNLALGSCRAGLNVARSVETEPILISQLVRTACVNITLNGLHRTLAAGQADPAALLAVQKQLAEMDKHDSFVIGMRGERACFHVLCTNLENGTVPRRTLLGLLGARRRPVVCGPRGGNLRGEHRAGVARLDAAPFHRCDRRQQAARRRTGARLKELSPRLKFNEMPALARIMTPAWEKCHEAFRRQRAKLRCAMLALAVERYRVKHGAWPDDLVALVPDFIAAIPADPYTDQPLKYRKAANGVSVYSVGPDHTLVGDFFDRRRAADLAAPSVPNPPEYFEFHLWDADARLR